MNAVGASYGPLLDPSAKLGLVQKSSQSRALVPESEHRDNANVTEHFTDVHFDVTKPCMIIGWNNHWVIWGSHIKPPGSHSGRRMRP